MSFCDHQDWLVAQDAAQKDAPGIEPETTARKTIEHLRNNVLSQRTVADISDATRRAKGDGAILNRNVTGTPRQF